MMRYAVSKLCYILLLCLKRRVGLKEWSDAVVHCTANSKLAPRSKNPLRFVTKKANRPEQGKVSAFSGPLGV